MCCHAVPASAGGGLVSGLLLAAEALTLHEAPLCSIWQSVRRLAIVGMGVFALGLHTVERRGREIGVRRVIGVSARSIVVLLSGEFTGLVLTASLVVCPLITLR